MQQTIQINDKEDQDNSFLIFFLAYTSSQSSKFLKLESFTHLIPYQSHEWTLHTSQLKFILIVS